MKDLLPPEASAARSLRSTPCARCLILFVTVLSLAGLDCSSAQEPTRPAANTIQITFLPPPLEHATYSLGIFDAKTNKLVRRLQEFALEKDFTVGLNGLSTTWDGRDDTGKPVAPGRYAARGHAVGPLKIMGESIQGNDWTAANEALRLVRVDTLSLVPADGGLALVGLLADGHLVLARFGGEKSECLWQRELPTDPEANIVPWPNGLTLYETSLVVFAPSFTATFHLEDGTPNTPAIPQNLPPARPNQSVGKDGSTWKIEDGVLSQYSPQGERLRTLAHRESDPVPVAVSASKTADRLYLLESGKDLQRVRGLSWLETREESGHPVSTWQTFFDCSIHAPEKGSVDVDNLPNATAPVEINLDDNPLSPGKPQKIRLVAAFDAKGSYLATADGLRLRRVSERPNLENAHLAKGKPPSPLAFFQYDGAATDEFSITGVHRIMAFDAGEFELTATGEKPADTKTAEPPDL